MKKRACLVMSMVFAIIGLNISLYNEWDVMTRIFGVMTLLLIAAISCMIHKYKGKI